MCVNGRWAVYVWIMPLAWLLSWGCAQAVVGHWTGCHNTLVGQPALCRTFLNRINAAHCATQACVDRVVRTDPRFTNPPWKVLNPRHHEILIARLLRHGYNLNLSYPLRLSHAVARLEARLFIAAGGKIWLWRGRVIPVFSTRNPAAPPLPPPPAPPVAAVPLPAPPGPETIVDLHRPAPPGHPDLGWDHTYLVTPHLSGPDPRVGNETFYWLMGGRVQLMRGKPYIVSRGTVAYPILRGFFLYAAGFFHFISGKA